MCRIWRKWEVKENFFVLRLSAAARTGSLLKFSELARDVGVSQPTAEQQNDNNVTKRAVKTPKMYFLDTVLAAHLTWSNVGSIL